MIYDVCILARIVVVDSINYQIKIVFKNFINTSLIVASINTRFSQMHVKIVHKLK